MKVIELPPVLDLSTQDALHGAIAGVRGSDEPVLLDGRHLRFVDPVGMTALLSVAAVLHTGGGGGVRFRPPQEGEVGSYLARMGFAEAAAEVLRIEGALPRPRPGGEDVLLEITPIRSHRDVHAIVDRIQERATAILSRNLHYPPTGVIQFSVVLSEVCQNIVEHAEAPGWVAAQSYLWARRLGRRVVVLSVSDTGRGFRGSLASEHASRYGDRWSDAAALEAAFLHGTTRLPDPGRGQGLQQIRRQVGRWEGMIVVRSGEARIADVPGWGGAVPPLESGLPPIPGAHIAIALPERTGGGA